MIYFHLFQKLLLLASLGYWNRQASGLSQYSNFIRTLQYGNKVRPDALQIMLLFASILLIPCLLTMTNYSTELLI